MDGYREIPVPEGRLYAVGDIHGCAEETSLLLHHFDEREKITDQDLVVFIGDYVDRGPGSKEVVDLLLEFQRDYPETVFLKGNHELMLLDYLGLEGAHGELYLKNGGKEALESYTVRPRDIEQGQSSLPATHLAFFLNLERLVVCGDYIFAHAGVNPLRDLRQQQDEDLYWIRNEFIHNIHHFEKTVLFGHTPHEDILLHLPYKIGIDTALVYGNKLSCVELTEQRILQIKRGETKVRERSFRDPWEKGIAGRRL